MQRKRELQLGRNIVNIRPIHHQSHYRLAEAAKATTGDPKRGATGAVFVDNNTPASMSSPPVLRPHKTHNA
ncbi:hypothetical protein BJY01DRAFT_229776 [Aspergillus pseudoustus]|uniref:Uncharacterized protein n=1 Tax=Aspergillus pseudoustus TaxID=1810923 RepID=A0ABR4IF38_9EURO